MNGCGPILGLRRAAGVQENRKTSLMTSPFYVFLFIESLVMSLRRMWTHWWLVVTGDNRQIGAELKFKVPSSGGWGSRLGKIDCTVVVMADWGHIWNNSVPFSILISPLYLHTRLYILLRSMYNRRGPRWIMYNRHRTYFLWCASKLTGRHPRLPLRYRPEAGA